LRDRARRRRGDRGGLDAPARRAEDAPAPRAADRAQRDPVTGQTCTTISELPSGSRNQNIGGTGSPIRETCSSTSTPLDFRYSCVASTSSVASVTPVSTPVASPSRGGASAIPVLPLGG